MTDVFKAGISSQPTNFNADDYNTYIKYFLETELSGIVFNLTEDELHTFFEMVTRYPAIIAKVFLLPGDALVNYIMFGNEFYEALKDPHEGIDYTPSHIVKQYKEWAKANNIPEPTDMVVSEGLDLTPMLEYQKNL
jgi:hypothetical protein